MKAILLVPLLCLLGLSQGQTLEFTSAYTVEGNVTDSGFGYEVIISGNYVIIYDESFANDSGAIYVYQLNDGAALYSMKGSAENAEFGFRLAVSGNYLVIAQLSPSGDGNGTVFVYWLNNGTLVYDLFSAPSSYFGYSITASSTDNILVVGAPGDVALPSAGDVFVYFLNNGTFKYLVSGSGPGVELGSFVGVSGNYLVATGDINEAFVYNLTNGSPLYNITTGLSNLFLYGNYLILPDQNSFGGIGSIGVYDLTDGSLLYSHNGTTALQAYGHEVRTLGNYMVVKTQADFAVDDATFVYTLDTGSFLYQIPGFTPHVAVNGNYLFLSNAFDTVNGYDLSNGSLLGNVTGPNGSYFDSGLASSQNYLLVSDLSYLNYTGAVYAYDFSLNPITITSTTGDSNASSASELGWFF